MTGDPRYSRPKSGREQYNVRSQARSPVRCICVPPVYTAIYPGAVELDPRQSNFPSAQALIYTLGHSATVAKGSQRYAAHGRSACPAALGRWPSAHG